VSTLTTEDRVSDAIDEFCYDVAQAVRRLLGLDSPDTVDDDDEEEEGGDD